VEAQVDASLVEADRSVVRIGAGIANVSDDITRRVLGNGRSQTKAESPMNQSDVFSTVLGDWNSLHVDEVPTVLKRFHPFRDRRCENGKGKIVSGEFGHGLAASLRSRQRSVKVGDLGRSGAADPIVLGRQQFWAQPGRGGCQVLTCDRSHQGLFGGNLSLYISNAIDITNNVKG